MPLDSQVVRTLLMRSAVPFPGPPVTGCGAGVLDAAAALQALDAWIDRALPESIERIEDG